MRAPDVDVDVVPGASGDRPEDLTLRPGPGFPERPIFMLAVLGSDVYRVVRKGGDLLVLSKNSREDAGTFFRAFNPSESGYQVYPRGVYEYDTENSPGQALKRMAVTAMGRALGATFTGAPFEPRMKPPGLRAQLFVLAHSPEGFLIPGGRFGREMSYVLYHIDVFD
jgi:hypothetical protein